MKRRSIIQALIAGLGAVYLIGPRVADNAVKPTVDTTTKNADVTVVKALPKQEYKYPQHPSIGDVHVRTDHKGIHYWNGKDWVPLATVPVVFSPEIGEIEVIKKEFD